MEKITTRVISVCPDCHATLNGDEVVCPDCLSRLPALKSDIPARRSKNGVQTMSISPIEQAQLRFQLIPWRKE